MIVDVKDIKRQPGSKKKCSFECSLKMDDCSIECGEPVVVDIELTNTGKSIFLKGIVRGSILLDCCRCLEPFRQDIVIDLEEEFLPYDPARVDKNLDYTQLSIFYYKQDRIDMDDVVKQNFLASIPFLPLCNPQCKGICSGCGADLNKDSCSCEK